MSWIVSRLSDGKAIWEFYSPSIVSKINTEKYRVEESLAYLQRLNAELRAKRTAAALLLLMACSPTTNPSAPEVPGALFEPRQWPEECAGYAQLGDAWCECVWSADSALFTKGTLSGERGQP
jgi:hypothetical protein